MSDLVTPERIKAFLDDLALLSSKHGLFIEHGEGAMCIVRADPDQPVCGYVSDYRSAFHAAESGEMRLRQDLLAQGVEQASVESIDISLLSAHERFSKTR